ncbi:MULTISPECIES: glycogen synthase [unclassified Methylobacterium]|uniref:glycogen synthase n=1 Tax=unclassified Methylobacterium TaxID=2615210 RepID=UPI0022698BBC|nr:MULTISPECIES: glycogen synthase [unclassified Methylobacterium]
MRPLAFHWHRFLEWFAHRDIEWANARIRGLRDWRDRRVGDADRHGAAADAICPPTEWDRRLWSRGQHTDLHPPPGA